MKTLRRLCAAFVLTLALSLSAFAGDMSTGIAATDPATNIFLSLLQSLLSLF